MKSENQISPGSKGWIVKYFDLFEKEQILYHTSSVKNLSDKEFIHLRLLESGVVFGYPVELLIAKNLDTSTWTYQEKLKVLVFEAMLFIYIKEDRDIGHKGKNFITSLVDFYQKHNSRLIGDLLKIIIKESPSSQLEKAFVQRLGVKANILEGNFWVNHISNSFIYLDVLLFRQYLRRKTADISSYSELAQGALGVLAQAIYKDGVVTESERKMFKQFLASANLKEKQRSNIYNRFKKGENNFDAKDANQHGWLYRRYLLDLYYIAIIANQGKEIEDFGSVDHLGEELNVPKKERNASLIFIERFVLEHHQKIEFLKLDGSYERMVSNLSHRMSKVLIRNKDKLIIELKESKELISLVRKSMKEELNETEKQAVKDQFFDIVRSVPALAIFMLPGGALLLPIILKVIPELIPSAFRDNELNKEEP